MERVALGDCADGRSADNMREALVTEALDAIKRMVGFSCKLVGGDTLLPNPKRVQHECHLEISRCKVKEAIIFLSYNSIRESGVDNSKAPGLSAGRSSDSLHASEVKD